MTAASFDVQTENAHCTLLLCGEWKLGASPDGEAISNSIPQNCSEVSVDASKLERWDSSLAIALLQVARWCEEKK